jgi:hypothetical protein
MRHTNCADRHDACSRRERSATNAALSSDICSNEVEEELCYVASEARLEGKAFE